MLRLFYAVELRYGVPVDIASKVRDGEAIRLGNGFFTCIWQGDANEAILRSRDFAQVEPTAWNLCRPEIFSVREVAAEFGRRLGREPEFSGTETATALLGNPSRIWAELGDPEVGMDRMQAWIADWVRGGGRSLGRPTHFETRDGRY